MTDLEQRLAQIEWTLRGTARRAATPPRLLITGGTGTLGVALTEHFLAQGYQLTVLNRDAHRQALYQERFPAVNCVLADICDAEALLSACIGQDIVIHAAALKRVDVGETAINEFARVNIDGTRTVARAAALAGVPRALFISSDKAVAPLNFYGMTKAVGERLWLAHDEYGSYLETRFSVVRYGNVMGSNGSVLNVWRDRLAKGLPIVVRMPETTRFFMRVSDAVQLVADALSAMQGDDIFVPAQTPAFALFDLAREITPASNWTFAPLGPREKQHEVLLAHSEYWENCGPTMVRVLPGRAGNLCVPDAFQSEFAPRLTGAEAVARLEGKL